MSAEPESTPLSRSGPPLNGNQLGLEAVLLEVALLDADQGRCHHPEVAQHDRADLDRGRRRAAAGAVRAVTAAATRRRRRLEEDAPRRHGPSPFFVQRQRPKRSLRCSRKQDGRDGQHRDDDRRREEIRRPERQCHALHLEAHAAIAGEHLGEKHSEHGEDHGHPHRRSAPRAAPRGAGPCGRPAPRLAPMDTATVTRAGSTSRVPAATRTIRGRPRRAQRRAPPWRRRAEDERDPGQDQDLRNPVERHDVRHGHRVRERPRAQHEPGRHAERHRQRVAQRAS